MYTIRKVICCILLLAFSFQSVSSGHAQSFLPPPSERLFLSPVFSPPVLTGLKVYPKEPFRFDFILDPGSRLPQGSDLKKESERLIRYFLASLTIPGKDLWVNLSPYEKDRIIPEAFGQTEMGRDLLEQDYILKQLTASLLYPEGETGKKFWQKVYALAQEKYGTTDIPIDTFNKVWIVPDKAVVYENVQAGAVYITQSRLKVMLEQDYLASGSETVSAPVISSASEIARAVLREVVIPEMEKEVNEGEHFTRLRQVYQSLILAAWYKKKIRQSLLSAVYVDRNKTAGVNIDDPEEAKKIWQKYMEAFRKGVFNYIKNETDLFTGEDLPRKYFSGGFQGEAIDLAMQMLPFDPAHVPARGMVIEVTAKEWSNAPDVLRQGETDAAESAADIPPFNLDMSFEWQKFFPYIRDVSAEDFSRWYTPDGNRKLKEIISGRVSEGRGNTHVFQQSGDEFSPVFELMDNSIDAVFRKLGLDFSLGQFGEGGLQVLSYLQEELRREDGQLKGDMISWVTSTPGDKGEGRRVLFFRRGGKIHIYFDKLPGTFDVGTTFTARLSRFERDPDFISRMQVAVRVKYGWNNQIRIVLNGELVNPHRDTVYFGGQGLENKYLVDDQGLSLEVNIFKDGFSVRDHADGMSDSVLLTKLPRPRAGENTPDDLVRRRTQVDIEKAVDAEISQGTTQKQMKMRIYAGGRSMVEQETGAEGNILPEELTIRLPAVTTLTDDKNDIVIDATVESSIHVLTGDFLLKMRERLFWGNVSQVLAMINGYLRVMMFLRKRAVAGNGYDFVEDFVSRARKELFLPYLQQNYGNILFLPRTLSGALEGQDLSGLALFYLDDAFFTGSSELLDSSLNRSRSFRGQRVYVLPSEDKALMIPFGREALFISNSQEETLLQAPDRHKSAEFMNAVLRENGIVSFTLPAEEAGNLKEDLGIVLQRLEEGSGLSAGDTQRLRNNLQSAALSANGLAQAVESVESSSGTLGANTVEEVTSDGVMISTVSKPDADDPDWRPFRKMHPQGALSDGHYLWNDAPEFVVTDTNNESVFNSNEIIGWEQRADRSYRWAINSLTGKKSGRYSSHDLLQNSTATPFGLTVNQGRFVMNIPLRNKLSAGDVVHLLVSVMSLAVIALGVYAVGGFTSTIGLISVGLISIIARQTFWDVRKNIVPGEGLRIRQSLEIAAFLILCLQYQYYYTYYYALSYLFTFLGIGYSLWWLLISDYGGLYFLRKHFDLSSFEAHLSKLLPSKSVPGFVDLSIPVFGNWAHLLFDLNKKRSYRYSSPSAMAPVPGPEGDVYIADKFFLGGMGVIARVTLSERKIKRIPVIIYPSNQKLLYSSADDKYVYALTRSKKKSGEVCLYVYTIGSQYTVFDGLVLRGKLNTEESDLSFTRWQGSLYGVAGKKLVSIDLADGSLQEIPLPADRDVTRYIGGPGRYDFVVLGGGIGSIEKFSGYIFDKEARRFYNLWELLPPGEWSSTPVLAADHVLLPATGSMKKFWKRLDFPSSEEIEAVPESESGKEYLSVLRLRRLFDNLASLPPELITDSLAPLLPFASARVLGRLSDEVRSSLLRYVQTTVLSAENELFLFFERMDPVLDTLVPEKLNTVVSAWVEALAGDDPFSARGFLDQINRRYVVGQETMPGVRLLASEYQDQAPPAMREFWHALLYPLAMSVPARDTFESLVPGEGKIIHSLEDIPLAHILSARNRADSDLDISGLDRELGSSFPGDVKAGYDQEIFSAISGQDPTTLPRELLQNARDALRSGQEGQQKDIAVRLYSVARTDGKYTLALQIRDKGDGMDDYVMINKLLPLDATSKSRHMGQGFYTIWAQTLPGDRIVVESLPVSRVAAGAPANYGFVLSASRKEDGTLVVDSLQEREVVSLQDQEPLHGTLIRQERVFESMAELRRYASKIKKRFEYYGSAVEDVDIFLNGEKLNRPGEPAASLRFGDFSDSRLLITGHSLSRVLQDNLPMPAPLDAVASRYWDGVIPVEVQRTLLSWGVDTEIPDGILPTKARTEPAYPAYWPLIRASEGLKAMLALAVRSDRINDPDIVASVKASLERAGEDESRYPEIRRFSAYLNNAYTSSDKQSRFDLVPEEDMLKHWYRLMVRVKFDTVNGPMSLLDIYRGGSVQTLDAPEIDSPFILPPQHEDIPSVLKARPLSTSETFSVTLERVFPVRWRKAAAVALTGAVIFLAEQGGYPYLTNGIELPRSVPESRNAVSLYQVTGMRPGEYLIHAFHYSDGNGKTVALREMEPQGKRTGEAVIVTMPLGPHQAGETIYFPQIVDGVPERIMTSTIPLALFDQTSISRGHVTVKQDFTSSGTITYIIPRRDKNNRLPAGQIPVVDQDNQEFHAMQTYPVLEKKIRAISEDVSLSAREKVLKTLEMTADFIEYDDTREVYQGDVTATDALMKITGGGDPDKKAGGACGDISRYYGLFLNRMGYRALDSSVHIYKNYGRVFSNSYHADTYVVGQNGTIIPFSWGTDNIVNVRNVQGEYDPPVPGTDTGVPSTVSGDSSVGLTEFQDSFKDVSREYKVADDFSFRARAAKILMHPVAFVVGGITAFFLIVTGIIFARASIASRRSRKASAQKPEETQTVRQKSGEAEAVKPVNLPDINNFLQSSGDSSAGQISRDSVAPAWLPGAQEWSRRLFADSQRLLGVDLSRLNIAPAGPGMKGRMRLTDNGTLLLENSYAQRLDDLFTGVSGESLLRHPSAWLFLLNAAWQVNRVNAGSFLPFSVDRTLRLIEEDRGIPADPDHTSVPEDNPGGIDLDTSRFDLAISHDGGMDMDISPAILQKYADISGLVPVIVAIKPEKDIRAFFISP